MQKTIGFLSTVSAIEGQTLKVSENYYLPHVFSYVPQMHI
jgi:hypothetical protein